MLVASWKHKEQYIYIQLTCPHSWIRNLIYTRHCSRYFSVKVREELPNLLQKLMSLICSCYGMNWNWTLWDGGRGGSFGVSNCGRQCVSKSTGLGEFEKCPGNSK